MSTLDKETRDFAKGYNQGYLLAQELPKLKINDFGKLPKAIQEKPRMQGIVAGMKQQRTEKYLQKMKGKQTPQKNITPNKGKSRS